jgi:hypothetical protein
MPSHKDESPIESAEPHEQREVAQYRAPRIDLRLLTIVVHPSPYSRRTPLSRSRKLSLRRRWSS